MEGFKTNSPVCKGTRLCHLFHNMDARRKVLGYWGSSDAHRKVAGFRACSPFKLVLLIYFGLERIPLLSCLLSYAF